MRRRLEEEERDLRRYTVLSDRMGHETERGYKSRDNTIKMDFYQAGARQGGDEAEAGGGGERLSGEEEGVCQIHHPV